MTTPAIPTWFRTAVALALDNPRTSLAQLANLIEPEPSAVAAVMGLANELAGVGCEPIRTLRAAVLRLGKANLRRVLLDPNRRGSGFCAA